MKLIQPHWYVVQAEGIKPHFCSNYYLATAVANNIERRYNVNTLIEAYNDTLPLLAQNTKGTAASFQLKKVFNLTPLTFPKRYRKTVILPGEIAVSWDSLDLTIPKLIKSDYEKANREKTYDNFYKFHTGLGSLCMTEKQMEKLLEFSAI